mmetsp:Transcript_14245/g.16965  ORF Transcript_14245/g.16965 Transcript_14245/m.16965 type:complete len:94 (+) Transcript_14245:86-367(+)
MTKLCNALTYVSFLAIGTSCGWFVVNGLYNLVANEPKIAEGGLLIGQINRNGSIASLVLCALFGLYPFLFGKISNSADGSNEPSTVLCGNERK